MREFRHNQFQNGILGILDVDHFGLDVFIRAYCPTRRIASHNLSQHNTFFTFWNQIKTFNHFRILFHVGGTIGIQLLKLLRNRFRILQKRRNTQNVSSVFGRLLPPSTSFVFASVGFIIHSHEQRHATRQPFQMFNQFLQCWQDTF